MKKVLWVGESHTISSGYGTYSKEVLTRLHNAGIEIAEFASYGLPKHQKGCPWKYYPNAVINSDPRWQEYKSHPLNEFGAWRFNRVLLDFKPDIVIDIRDPWVMSYEWNSPYRPYFHHCIMPTVDSIPQRPEWISLFTEADSVLTYSDFAYNHLTNIGSINTVAAAYPGVDLDTFKPYSKEDKNQLRNSFGIDSDTFIVGAVMRNQARKFYPDLFKAFKQLLAKIPNAILHVHTSYPDNGWEIPELLLEHQVSNSVIFTYVCRDTKKFFVSPWQGAKTYSPYTNGITATLPSTAHGIEHSELATLYNLHDVFVQYANCEGWGMPQVEATACGVHLMAIDYSAMSDVVQKTNGTPLTPLKLQKDKSTHADRAIPNNDDLVDKLFHYYKMTQEEKYQLSKDARDGTVRWFNWDDTAKKWEKHIRGVSLKKNQGRWDAVVNVRDNFDDTPEGMDYKQLLMWLYSQLGDKSLYSFEGMTLLNNLHTRAQNVGDKYIEFNTDMLCKDFERRLAAKIQWENARMGKIQLPDEDYLHA